MSTSPFVTCILESAHPALRACVWAHLPLQNFKSANECTKFHHNRQVCQPVNLLHVFWRLCPALIWGCLPLHYFRSTNEEPVYQVSSKLMQAFGSDARTNVYSELAKVRCHPNNF
ncbi:hypothetical protein AVEN_252886-1 [Araneus ventricosus]|uniref:Uncharacterized protein n=1 Tax=Araneus ventricosus TaxID=182803 RepID=A0A4Y2KZN7_ARAVE|nr:hypothetical protein AVEN_252886-1 [Araneus ventricosus]